MRVFFICIGQHINCFVNSETVLEMATERTQKKQMQTNDKVKLLSENEGGKVITNMTNTNKCAKLDGQDGKHRKGLG